MPELFPDGLRQERTAVQELRQALTPALLQHFQDMQAQPLLEAFTLLRRLRTGDVHLAQLCHRVLAREARRNLAEWGFIDDGWAHLIRLTFNVIEAHGYEFRGGRWTEKECRVEGAPASLAGLALAR